MRIPELKNREPLDAIVAETLSEVWSFDAARSVEVSFGPRTTGQQWVQQPLLSAYFVPDIRSVVRRFLAASFRFSPRPRRMLGQWLLTELLASGLGLRWATRPAFRVDPELEHAEMLLVMPGNQRLRVFDFRDRSVRVVLKAGFEPSTMRREIDLRTACSGPFPVIRSVNDAPLFFEEPLIHGFTLPRCPPWWNRRRLRRRAFRLLNDWLDRTRRVVDSVSYAEELISSIEAMRTRLGQRVDDVELRNLPETLGVLANHATCLQHVTLARSHGDFQAGNIYVADKGRRVWLLDWEHSRERSRSYDFLVFGLRSRSPVPPGTSWRAFSAGAMRVEGLTRPGSQHWRRSRLALFLMEDLAWYLEESTSGPLRGMAPGLRRYLDGLASFGPNLTGLFKVG